MRQYKKKEMLETTDLLIEGNNYITNNCRTGNEEHVIEILGQCQEMAILLGNCLETLGEAGKALVPVLEDYCEKIYQFSQSLSDEFICRKIAKQTTRQLAGLKISIIEQIPEDKIEIVFFPYKASMWDSLESVWRAAAEDPECDACVVPIPYYEKNQQGELAVMHYEGDKFPSDVPVIHYMDYNLAERRPDVAFIHNPYDQYNYVTSIHPAYYVQELKKYVGKVAYIPYFVSPEPNPNSLEVQAQKKGFVLQPGVTDSDLVFVQSEDMKQLYVNILEKEIPNVNRKHWEDKIFGLGSPKLDRVHSTKRNDDLLSAAWHSLIYDSAGNRKKVIFYNTSLHDLLNQQNMMEKIADTLAFFKGRDDCVLWWRPHPLYESTLASMMPGLLPFYRKIVEDYKAEGWGIFDGGEDLDWAIAETDAYYGDGSSVVQLYKEAGKPVLYQDTRVKNSVEEEVELPIWPCAFCVDGDDIWFVHGKINVLMKYNISSEENVILGSIPNEVTFQETLYESIYKYKNYIYLIPCWAKAISVYDIETGEFCRIELKDYEKYQNRLLFGKSYSYGKYLYCIPYNYSMIVKIDMEQKNIEYIEFECMNGDGEQNYISDSVRVGNQIFMTWNFTNYLTLLNLEKDTVHMKKYGDSSRRYVRLCCIDSNLYLYDLSGELLCKINGIENNEKQICRISPRGCLLYAIGDKLILDSVSDALKIFIDDKSKRILKESREMSVTGSAMDPTYKGAVVESGKSNYLFDLDEKKWMFYKNWNESDEFEIKEKRIYQSLEVILLQSEEKENELLNLSKWIEEIKKMRDAENKIADICGYKIKEIVRGEFGSGKI